MATKKTKKYTAHGKFLITGEYAVLDNVPALAVPLKLNQYLEITDRDDQEITWKSYNSDGELWYQVITNVHDLYSDCINCDNPITFKLSEILNTALHLTSNKSLRGFDAVTTLDFDRKSGMGTSSTLISCIAQWLGCDPYQLQFKCFGGSGYDIACATAQKSIIYNYNNEEPFFKEVYFNPAIKEKLFFVYLNRKQNSRDSIAKFDKGLLTSSYREELSNMPNAFLDASDDLLMFEQCITRHEEIISAVVGIAPIKQQLFDDYQGAIKSLGGWGGDFVLATGGLEHRKYFKNKGYKIILEWDDAVLSY